jgi:predicted ATPase
MAFRLAPDPGVSAMAYLAFALWPLGQVDRAVSLIERMRARIADLTNANTLAYGAVHAAQFALMRGDRSRARMSVSELGRIVREHELPLFRAFSVFLEGWATVDAGAPADGLESMRRGAEGLREQTVLLFDGLLKITVSEGEARAGDLERAVATLDEALTTTERAGFRAFEAELHRVRGEILLKRDPANPAPAQEALQSAIAIARRQKARSFELRAALSLAKLCQSTGRPAEAHAVLASALEGFAPTQEFPEIEEALALRAALEAGAHW